MASTKSQLIANVNSSSTGFADNTTGDITPSDLRGVEIEEINSWQQAPQVNSQIGTTGYTVVASDYGKVIIFNSAVPVAVSLPAAGTTGFFPFNVIIKNEGTGTVTTTPAVGTIDGALSLDVSTGQSVWALSDGSNWRSALTSSGSGGGGGGGAPGGSSTELQFRAGPTTFGGAAGTSWNNATSALQMDNGSIFINGGGAAFKHPLFVHQALGSGSVTPTDNYVNIFNIANDAIDLGSGGFMRGVFIQHAFGGSTCAGARSALNAALVFNGGATSSTLPAGVGHVTLFTQCEIITDDGGTLGAEKGGFFGANITVDAAPAAIHYQAFIGTEWNVTAQAGSSVLAKQAIRIASLPQDKVQGTQSDAGICYAAGVGGVGFRTGILFNMEGGAPISADGTLIDAGWAPGGTTWTTTNGVDFSKISFTGMAFKSPGFTVDGNGVVSCPIANISTAIYMLGTTPGIEMGSITTANTPFIDFHSSGNNTDFDARIIATGGTSTAGQGTLEITSAVLKVDGALAVSTGSTGTTGQVLTSQGSSPPIWAGGTARRLITSADVVAGVFNVYVNGGTGNDSNPGTSASPFATIQKGIDYVCGSIDAQFYDVTINVAAGTYTQSLVLRPFLGSGIFRMKGDTTTPANCLISTTNAGCIQAGGGNVRWTVEGFKFQTNGTGTTALNVDSFAVISIGYVEFGSMAGGYFHMQIVNGGTISTLMNPATNNGWGYRISGDAGAHMNVDGGGRFINFLNSNIDMVGLRTFAAATGVFVSGFNGSLVVTGGCVYRRTDQSNKIRRTASGNTTSGSNSISGLVIAGTDTSSLFVGMYVLCRDTLGNLIFPIGTTITAISTSTSVTVSNNATANQTGISVGFEIAVCKKYNAQFNAVVTGVSALPGNNFGTNDTGGQIN